MKVYKVYNATLDSYLEGRRFGALAIYGTPFSSKEEAEQMASLEWIWWTDRHSYRGHDIRVIEFDVRTQAEEDELQAFIDEDAEYEAERAEYDGMYPPGTACNSACGYCGRCN